MNKENKNIYWEGKIYVGVPDGESRYNYPSYEFSGDHDFKNGQDVTGLYELFPIGDGNSIEKWIAISFNEPVKEVNGAEEVTDDTIVIGINNGRVNFIKTFHYETEKGQAQKALSFVQDKTKFTSWYISQVGQWILEHKNDSGDFFPISIPL